MNQEAQSVDFSNYTELDTVAIDAEDVGHISDFFKYFEIPLPKELDDTLQNFAKTFKTKTKKNLDVTKDEELLQLENELRFQLAKAIHESNHPIFTDPAFEEEQKIMKSVSFNHLFNKELVKTLTEK